MRRGGGASPSVSLMGLMTYGAQIVAEGRWLRARCRPLRTRQTLQIGSGDTLSSHSGKGPNHNGDFDFCAWHQSVDHSSVLSVGRHFVMMYKRWVERNCSATAAEVV